MPMVRERFPHLVTDRAKPGVIAVTRRAALRQRVRLLPPLRADHVRQRHCPCWLICDAEAMNRYGLGLARPKPVNNQALIDAGYLYRADSRKPWPRPSASIRRGSRTLAHFNADAATASTAHSARAATATTATWATRHSPTRAWRR
jgi:hypothetical protein